jgi:hypothetical protein
METKGIQSVYIELVYFVQYGVFLGWTLCNTDAFWIRIKHLNARNLFLMLNNFSPFYLYHTI